MQIFGAAVLLSNLERDENVVSVPYDDTTRKPFKKDDALRGNSTNDIGWDMRARPFSVEQARLNLCV